MKVIATTGRDGYLLEANIYEIGRIMGEYSASARKIEVGSDIPVSDLYDATREIVQNSEERTKF